MTSDSPRRVAVLGCTGSIGRQAIEVAQAHPDLLTVVALAAGSDEAALRRLGEELDVDHAGLGADDAAALARLDEVDVVLNAIVGASGLSASVAALESGKLLALANKQLRLEAEATSFPSIPSTRRWHSACRASSPPRLIGSS
jgi:1-deoxy-D-xylulose-5-phosphate reductoisomerase